MAKMISKPKDLERSRALKGNKNAAGKRGGASKSMSPMNMGQSKGGLRTAALGAFVPFTSVYAGGVGNQRMIKRNSIGNTLVGATAGAISGSMAMPIIGTVAGAGLGAGIGYGTGKIGQFVGRKAFSNKNYYKK